MPLGTRDGLLVEHNFPADGTYEINLNISSIPGSELRGYPYGWLEYEHTVAVTIDGAKVFAGNIGGEVDSKALDQGQIKEVEAIKNRFRGIRVDVTAGRRSVGAAFVARSFAEGDYLLQSLVPGEGVPDIPRLYGMEIIGPYEPTGIAEPTESRARIFSCYPQDESAEQACATQILTNLSRGAFRRPVTSEDVAPALEFYAQGRAEGDFETGIQKGLMAILASTKFLYRAEPGAPPANVEPGSGYAISDLELAWRLSFFLWSQGPDETLLDARRATARCTSPTCSSGRSAACSPTSARARSSRTSRSSGSACAGSTPSIPTRGSIRTSTRTCGALSRRRWSSISTASCASAAASSIS